MSIGTMGAMGTISGGAAGTRRASTAPGPPRVIGMLGGASTPPGPGGARPSVIGMGMAGRRALVAPYSMGLRFAAGHIPAWAALSWGVLRRATGAETGIGIAIGTGAAAPAPMAANELMIPAAVAQAFAMAWRSTWDAPP